MLGRLSLPTTLVFLALLALCAEASHIQRVHNRNIAHRKRSGSGQCSASSRRVSVASKDAPSTTHSSSASSAKATASASSNAQSSSSSSSSGSCFPALDFKMPSDVPDDTSGWWCDPSTEYAFVGFSYEISACQSASQLKKDFANMRDTYNARYVRIYGACDGQSGYYNNIIEAAWDAGLGVQALVWFGFNGDNSYEKRRDDLFNVLHSNPKAKFVTRGVQFGSEPLYDGVLSPSALTAQVQSAQGSLKSLGIDVTISELQYGYQMDGSAGLKVMNALDYVDAHILPMFDAHATTAKASWSGIQNSIKTFWVPNAKGKKIYFTENGWPSVKGIGNIKPTSGAAVANVQNEEDYFNMLDDQCEYFKTVAGGGLAWFAHIYSDDMEEGYGILNDSGKPKFNFQPRTHC